MANFDPEVSVQFVLYIIHFECILLIMRIYVCIYLSVCLFTFSATDKTCWIFNEQMVKVLGAVLVQYISAHSLLETASKV